MKDLFFETPGEFEELFNRKNRKITDLMFRSIGEGIKFQKKRVTLFTITIGEDDYKYEITLPKSQWREALESCLESYEKWECSDETIDTYLLIKELKKWDTEQS